MKEKIKFCACRVGSRVQVGAYHWEIRGWLADEGISEGIEDGFTTDAGRFVDRDEAYLIAKTHVALPSDVSNLEAGYLYAGTNECGPEKGYDEVERQDSL